MITDGLNPFTVLLFMGAVLAGATLIVLYVVARVTKREPLARITLRLLAGGAGVYVVLFLVASLTSRNRVLAVGEEKHICEVDCHLAYSVAATKSEALASGLVRHTVTVKVRFDEETISSRRPRDATLTPNSRYVALIDAPTSRSMSHRMHESCGWCCGTMTLKRHSSSDTRTAYFTAGRPFACQDRCRVSGVGCQVSGVGC